MSYVSYARVHAAVLAVASVRCTQLHDGTETASQLSWHAENSCETATQPLNHTMKRPRPALDALAKIEKKKKVKASSSVAPDAAKPKKKLKVLMDGKKK